MLIRTKNMNVKLINPFINAVSECFVTTVGIKPERQAPYLKDNALAQGDITSIIGFAEKNVVGSIALSFPNETALKIYNIMMGENETRPTHEVLDLVGELTNIVASSAKQEFAKDNLSFHISIPTIVVGRNHTIHHQINMPVLAIPFVLDNKSFILEVTMKFDKKHQ